MYDIFFIGSTSQTNDIDFDRLKKAWPFAKRADSFEEAQKKTTTKMFWAVWPNVVIAPGFNFDYRPPEYEQEYVHIWPNNNDKNPPSVALFPKNKTFTKRELDYRFFIGMIKMNTIASYSKGYDVVFISFHEKYADQNYRELLGHANIFTNRILRINGIEGIHKAHIEAAKLSSTDMFWVVDADAKILPTFDFSLQLSEEETDIVHVWRSRNPINDLEYGYGGVKLLPTDLTINMDTSNPDMTTNISKRFKAMPEVSNITAFNSDPLSSWRSAFRECVKLSSRIIPGQNDVETEERLKIWVTKGHKHLHGDYARAGASAGTWFGSTYKDDPTMLAKINDYEWLTHEFDQHCKMFPIESFR